MYFKQSHLKTPFEKHATPQTEQINKTKKQIMHINYNTYIKAIKKQIKNTHTLCFQIEKQTTNNKTKENTHVMFLHVSNKKQESSAARARPRGERERGQWPGIVVRGHRAGRASALAGPAICGFVC